MTDCFKTVSDRRPVLTEMCETHQGRIIDTVCRDHNEVCCATCVSVRHRNCEDVVYLPDAAKGVSETNQYKQCIGQLDRVKLNAESTKEHIQQDQVRIQKECEAHLTEVKKMCKEARQRIDALENGTESELRTTLHSQGADLDTEIAQCSNVVTEVQALHAKLSAVSADDEAARFLLMMKANELICSTSVASCPVDRTAQVKQAILKLGTKLQSLLDGMGCRAISHAESMATKPSDGEPLKTGSTIREFSKPSNIGQFVAFNYGESGPVISGATFLDDGTVALIDSKSKTLKVLGDTCPVIKQCNLPDQPTGVCATGPHEVCVSTKSMLHVLFVDTRAMRVTARVLDVGRIVWDVAFRDDVYVLCDQTSTQRATKYDLEALVYSRRGELRRTCKFVANEVLHQSHDHSLFGLAVSGDGARIHVAIPNYGVITCNQQGDVLWKYADSDMTCRTYSDMTFHMAICAGDDGNVYACGPDWVVQLDAMGNKVRDVLTKDDGIQCPTVVCYDRVRRWLAVVTGPQYNCARLYVFQI